jgi:triacylglycerol lipase
MKNRSQVTLLFLLFNNLALADPQFIRSVDDLEDPSGYCLDIPGFGARLQKDAPINAHTCKYNRPGFNVDELFEMTPSNYLRMPEYDLCLSAASRDEGAPVHTIDCASAAVHEWRLHADGRLTPSDAPDLCVTQSSQRVFVNSSVGNLTPNSTRSISLEKCANELTSRQSWRWAEPDELETLTANTLRAGMPPAVAARIREFGNVVRAQETAELYAVQPRLFTAADVVVSEEIAYGPDAKHRLQVYSGVNRNHPRNAAPIILLVHGGGFARGNLQYFETAATYFAGLGYIAVNMTYALVPDTSWPSGSESVAAAVGWIKANATELKGNPEQIFVLGQSAGASIVAEFVFRPGLVDGDSPTVAGAILASPNVKLDAEIATPGELAYYGEDSGTWRDKQTLGNIERTSVPVLILVAEFDPDKFKMSAAELYRELVVDHGIDARFKQMRGHNHTSSVASLGTQDTQAAQEILDFMATVGRN